MMNLVRFVLGDDEYPAQTEPPEAEERDRWAAQCLAIMMAENMRADMPAEEALSLAAADVAMAIERRHASHPAEHDGDDAWSAFWTTYNENRDTMVVRAKLMTGEPL